MMFVLNKLRVAPNPLLEWVLRGLYVFLAVCHHGAHARCRPPIVSCITGCVRGLVRRVRRLVVAGWAGPAGAGHQQLMQLMRYPHNDSITPTSFSQQCSLLLEIRQQNTVYKSDLYVAWFNKGLGMGNPLRTHQHCRVEFQRGKKATL